jgi:hypothetical protein
MSAENSRFERYWLAILGLAVLILVCLLTLPWCRPLVRSQFVTLVRMPAVVSHMMDDIQQPESPVRSPVPADRPIRNDYVSAFEFAMTSASREGFSQERSRRLQQLANVFPEHAVTLYAHALRYATMSEIKLQARPDEQKFLYPKDPYKPPTVPPTMPEARDNFLNMAVAGEKLDPGNAYFPLMQAIALFDGHRDKEGLEAYMRASNAPHFDDYSWDEVEARSRSLSRKGWSSSMGRLAVMASVLMPHYAKIRELARLTTFLAAKRAMAGDTSGALALNMASVRIGSNMRAHSHTLIGSLVGIAVAAVGASKPGGQFKSGMSDEAWKALSGDQKAVVHTEAFCKYAVAAGRPEDAALIKREFDTGMEAKHIAQAASEHNPMYSDYIVKLITNWNLCLIVLANLLIMLALCSTAAILRLTKRDRGGVPALTISLVVAAAIVLCIHMDWAPSLSAINLAIQGADPSPEDMQFNLNNAISYLTHNPTVLRTGAACLSLLVPAITLLVLGIASAFKRNRERSTVISGLFTGGTVVLLCLLIGYCGGLAVTSRSEARMNNAIDSSLSGEGRYLAGLIGKHWPG